MKYRVYNEETNEFLHHHQLVLRPDGTILVNGEVPGFSYQVQPFLHLFDRTYSPVFVGDALLYKKEWLPKNHVSILPGLEIKHDYDEIIIQTSVADDGRVLYWLHLHKEGQHRGIAVWGEDGGFLKFLSEQGLIETVYNLTDRDQWIQMRIAASEGSK